MNSSVAQKDFAAKLQEIHQRLVESLDEFSTKLLSGDPIPNSVTNQSFDILDMMRNGSWVAADSISSISNVGKYLRTDMMSRSINALWKTPTSNKMWVFFYDLQDNETSKEKCLDHKSGPQLLKYCHDGGVYYAYNFVEDGDHEGHFDLPWGADQLNQNPMNVQPQVSSNRVIPLLMVDSS